MSPAVAATVDRAMSLRELEERVRASARRLELNPGPTHQQEARRLFRRASAARRLRLALLRRCQLL